MAHARGVEDFEVAATMGTANTQVMEQELPPLSSAFDEASTWLKPRPQSFLEPTSGKPAGGPAVFEHALLGTAIAAVGSCADPAHVEAGRLAAGTRAL